MYTKQEILNMVNDGLSMKEIKNLVDKQIENLNKTFAEVDKDIKEANKEKIQEMEDKLVEDAYAYFCAVKGRELKGCVKDNFRKYILEDAGMIDTLEGRGLGLLEFLEDLL